MPHNKTIAVLGSTGMLGQALVRLAIQRKHSVIGIARHGADIQLDISDVKALTDFFSRNKVDAVINCCAIVNLKACEDTPEEAYRTNARPSATLANLARVFSFKYVYISTDAFFDAAQITRHPENARVTLLNEYARTKYAGERFALTNDRALAVRTNIVGFRHIPAQPTFVEWALNALRSRTPITLFSDYFASSITARQFSAALLDLLQLDVCGLINVASRDVFSKADFITKLANRFHLSLTNATIGNAASTLFPPRGKSLGLDISLAEKTLARRMPSLEEVINDLWEEYSHELQS